MPALPDSIKIRSTERLAINLCDISRMEEFVRASLLKGKLQLDTSKVIRIDENRPDETAVEFICLLPTAAAICDIIRNHDRQVGDYETRVYINRGGAWAKVPTGTIFTEVADGKCQLNPKVFPAEVVLARPKGIPVKRVGV